MMKNDLITLRFKGFQDTPTIVSLIDLSMDGIKNGVSNRPGINDFDIKFINVVNLYHDDVIDTNKLEYVDIPYSLFSSYKVQSNDIFFTRSSLKLEGIAHCNINLDSHTNLVFDDHIMRIRPIIELVDPYYLKTYCLTSRARKFFMSRAKTGTMTTIGQEDISDLPVSLPSIEEQKKISNFFKLIGRKMQKQQEKIGQLELLKKGMMQKLFSQEVRFKDENGQEFPDWEISNVGDIFSERSERGFNDLELLSVTVKGGVCRRSDIDYNDNSSDDKSNYKMVQPEDIVYNSMRMWQGSSGVSRYTGIVSPAYTVLIPKKKIISNYFGYLFKTPEMIYQFKKFSQGLTSDTWNLKYPQIKDISIKVPTLDEQSKIVNILSLIDNKISLEKKKAKYLTEMKIGFSRKMLG